MDREVRFLYSVYPKKPIKNLMPNGRPINSPKTLSLTKEEVLLCMKSGTVYRRFGEDNRNERVTTVNLDRLHNLKFITEEEWKKTKDVQEVVAKVKEAAEEVANTTKFEFEDKNPSNLPLNAPTVDEETAIKLDSESKVEETTVEEEVSEEETTEDNSEEKVVEEETTEDVVEETEEAETDDRGTVVNTIPESEEQSESNNNNNYYNHRKKKRH